MSDETVRLLLEDILASGRDDWVSLAEICGFISRRALAETVPEKCDLILRTVRLLLEEELAEIGDLPAPTDPGFLVWPGSTEEVMFKFAERVVDRFDDPASWEYSTWLNLTSIGDRASADIVRDRSRKR